MAEIEARIQGYKDDITSDSDMVLTQSRLADEDMRFINVDGGQWDDNTANNGNDRARLELDIVSDYVNRFVGEWNQNRIGVEYKPEDGATDDDADLLNGIYRADFRQNSGKMAVDNAVDEVATVGYGCFKLKTFFEDEGDPENDRQRIGWEPINNSYDTVLWDSAAKRIDKRDAVRCTQLIPFTKKSFEAKWPGKKPVSAFTPETRFHSDWLANPEDIIYIAARYDIIEKSVTHYVYNNLTTGKIETYPEEDHKLIEDELKADEFKNFVRKRKVKTQIVEKVVFSGDEILEESKRIAGKYIPIIAMYGYHAFVDNSERYRGLVRKLKDPARLFNSQVSQLAENSASSGQEIPIFTEDQIEGYEADWADRNNKPYLLLNKMLDDQGNPLPTGPGTYLKPPQLDGSTAALMSIVPNYVQQVTGRAPEETRDPRASGKAITEARKIENLNTQTINDNIFNSIEWSGVVYEAMVTDGIYTTKRMINTLSKDGTESPEQLMKTVLDEETGRLVESNDLNGKRFRVYADIGPQYETLREQTVEDLKGTIQVISQIPGGEEYLAPMLATLFENMNGVGLGPLKEMNRKKMISQGLIKPKTDEEKQMLAQQQEAAQQPDPQQQLIEAAAAQAEGEARERESKVLDNTASANLKTAKTQQVLSDIEIDQAGSENDRIKTLTDVRNQVFQNVETLQ